MPMCTSSSSNGTLLFALWNPREQSEDITNVTSRCQCRVTSTDDAQMYVYVRPMDVRLPPADTDDCSRLTLQDVSSTMLNSSCRDSSPLLFGTHLLQTGEIKATTPIDLTLLLHQNQLPYMAWIGFSSTSKLHLFWPLLSSVSCEVACLIIFNFFLFYSIVFVCLCFVLVLTTTCRLLPL